MQGTRALEFINRERELSFLSRCLSAPGDRPALVFLRGPSGFGKSSLTDRFRLLHQGAQLPFCMVDPDILDSPAAPSIYQGLFLQRCAHALDEAAKEGRAPWMSLSDFLRSRRWKTAKEKPKHDLIEELPSPETLYKQALDYAARIFSFGRFEAKVVLESDQSYAVTLSASYVQHVLEENPLVLVVREAQLIDLHSLKSLLGWQLAGAPSHLIFEYTTKDGCFHPDHEKAILRAAEIRGSFSVLDVLKLDRHHVEQLIRSNIRSDFSLEATAHISWSGNLRSLLELKFRVGVGQDAALPSDVAGVLQNLLTSLSEHIQQLAPLERLVLGFLRANVEPLAEPVLHRMLFEADPLLRSTQLIRVVNNLIEVHGFLKRVPGALRLHNESIVEAVDSTPAMRSLVAMAEKKLRDHYKTLVSSADFAIVGLPAAVRQVFRLCAATRDVTGLMQACNGLTDQVRLSHDQTPYIDAVSQAIEADRYLYEGDFEDLSVWAAALAYDTSDWGKAADLLEASGSRSSFALAMRAFALQEIGRHDEALALAATLRAAQTADEHLVARLIEVLVRGCRGETGFARNALIELVENPTFQQSPLLGYAYRFFDVAEGLAASRPRLEASVAWFARFGLDKAKAYSELPTAMVLARLGRTEEARAAIYSARSTLDAEVRDQHIILNNDAAVDLLTETPDVLRCTEQLSMALRFARDDFSELTIITNLSIAWRQAGDLDRAGDFARHALRILDDHSFADRDIFWPVCFNVVQIFDECGASDDRERALRLLRENRVESVNQEYWDFRFGLTSSVPSEYEFLARKSFHPVYLSHWTMELEGLRLLIEGRPQ